MNGHSPPGFPRTRSELALLAALVLVAFLGNVVHAPLFFGVDFLFGSIAVLVVAARFGPLIGTAAGILAAVNTIALWHHPYAVVIFGAEAAFVGVVVARWRVNVLIAAAIYWLGIGIPLVFLFYGAIMSLDVLATTLVALKQAVNGVSNALVASALVLAIPALQPGGRADGRVVPIREIVFHVLAALVLVPAIAIVIVGAREEVDRIEADVQAQLDLAADAVSTFVDEHQGRQVRAVTQLAEAAREHGMEDRGRLQAVTRHMRGAFEDFHNMYVADATGTTIAFDPPLNERGEPTVGLSFGDRPYFRTMRDTGATVVSEIFQGRGGVFAPIVTVSVPVFGEEGEFEGFALGALDLGNLGNVLERIVPSGFRATILDRDEDVIASTEPSVRPFDRFRERVGGTYEPLPDGHYRWIPPEATGGVVARWKSSYFGRTLGVGPQDRWTLLVEAPIAPHQAWLQGRYIQAFGLMLVLAVVALGISYAVSGAVAEPIAALMRATRNVPDALREGRPVEWPTSRIAEVDALVANFRSVAAELQRHIARLEEEVEERRRAEAALRAADRAKDEFLAMLAHELRNPLAPMMTSLEILRMRPEASARPLEVLERQVRHLVRMVDDLLDVSRITRGKVQLRQEPSDVRDPVRAAAEAAGAAMESGQHRFDVSLPDEPVICVVDGTRIEQVVSNLLQNAAKYTDRGGRVELSLATHAGDAVVRVRDTGTGIPPEVLPHVFDLFAQADRTLDRSQGGLGIGLTLVRRLVEMHGGRVSARSEGPGKGSEFEVRLPLATQAEAALPRSEPASLARDGVDGVRRVLVVDDKKDAAGMLAELLGEWGLEVRLAHDGVEALAAHAEFHPDVTFLDIGLPGMDGYAVARALRQRGEGGRIVALSGYGQPEDRRRALEAGFDQHLTKPVDAGTLKSALHA